MFTESGHRDVSRPSSSETHAPRREETPPRRRARARASARAAERKPRRNLIIDWLRQKPAPFLSYVRSLRVMDESLGLSLGAAYTLREPRLRLATTLFLDFAHDHTLSAGEIALLLDDAQRDSRDALEFLMERARAEVYDAGHEPRGFIAAVAGERD